jgi:hypothetical protein
MINNSDQNIVLLGDETTKKSDDCKEYQALKYKTMIATGTNIESKIDNETNEQQLHSFLDNEIIMNKKQSWSKLTKTEKIKKVKFYLGNKGKEEYNLSADEIMNARRFILMLIERKKISKNNDIIYDEEKGLIEKINVIEFNETTRKFTLNKSLKSNSPSGKKTVKNKSSTKTTN